MLPTEILCHCGQKYGLGIQPFAGRMPRAATCPVCGVAGPALANEIIARTLPLPRPAGAGLKRRRMKPFYDPDRITG